jgi:hypothetical protein
MTKYLFLILDRYEASFSKSFQIKSNLKPKILFRNCMLEYAKFEEEYFEDNVAGEICRKGKNTTWDDEERSFLLIELEN